MGACTVGAHTSTSSVDLLGSSNAWELQVVITSLVDRCCMIRSAVWLTAAAGATEVAAAAAAATIDAAAAADVVAAAAAVDR